VTKRVDAASVTSVLSSSLIDGHLHAFSSLAECRNMFARTERTAEAYLPGDDEASVTCASHKMLRLVAGKQRRSTAFFDLQMSPKLHHRQVSHDTGSLASRQT